MLADCKVFWYGVLQNNSTRGRVGAMKHRKINRAKLDGELVKNEMDLQMRYQLGPFRYQFQSTSGESRVMNCSSIQELDWLAEQVKAGEQVYMERLSVQQ